MYAHVYTCILRGCTFYIQIIFTVVQVKSQIFILKSTLVLNNYNYSSLLVNKFSLANYSTFTNIKTKSKMYKMQIQLKK